MNEIENKKQIEILDLAIQVLKAIDARRPI